MGACFDATCVECGAHIGWFGKMKDRPPCSRCGHKLSAEELEDAHVALEEIKRQVKEDQERKLAARTPEDIDAAEEGRKAYKPGMGPLNGLKANPYRKTGATPDKRKHKWFMHGFYAAEHEYCLKGGR